MPNTLYVTQAGALALQSAGIAGWLLPVVNLCAAVPSPPDRLAVIGDFTLAAYTGYADQACVMTGGFVDGPAGPVYMLSPLLSFPGPTSGAGVSVVGWVLEDSGSHVVWAWGVFDHALDEQTSTDLVAFTIKINEDESYTVDVIAP